MLLKINKPSIKSVVKFFLQLVIVLIVYFSVKAFMQRDLVNGSVPSLGGVQLDGSAFNIHARRDQPILLYFWATWCSVCKLTEASIASISEDYAVITVAMNSGAGPDIKGYLQERGISFPVIVDEQGEIAGRFGIRGVPTSFVIDSHGNIDFTETGYTTGWGLRLRLWLAEY